MYVIYFWFYARTNDKQDSKSILVGSLWTDYVYIKKQCLLIAQTFRIYVAPLLHQVYHMGSQINNNIIFSRYRMVNVI